MNRHSRFIQRKDNEDDGGNVMAKNRSDESFAKDFGSGLPPLTKPEEVVATPDTTEKPVAEVKPITETTEEVVVDAELEAAASWLTDDEEDGGGTPPPVIPATTPAPTEPNADFTALKEKADKYEKLTNSEVFRLVDAFAASGEKDMNKFIGQVAGEDISKKSFEQIYDIHLRNLGMSDDSREKLLAKFEQEDYEDQELMILPIKQGLETQRSEKLNAFLNSYQTVAGSKENQIPAEEIARTNALVEQGRNSVKELVTGMVDKKWNGLHVSKEMAAELEQSILENPCPIVKEGKVIGYDLKKATRLAIASNEKYLKSLIKANIEMAKTAGWDEFVNKRNKPSKENTATPQTASTQSQRQKIAYDSDAAYGGGLSQPKFE